jgi:hypothetical protein
MQGQKGSQIVFGDSHDAARPMGNKLIAVDPAPDRPRTNSKHFRDLGDGEELDLIVAVAATTNTGESSHFQIAVTGGMNSRSHFSPFPAAASASRWRCHSKRAR